MSIVERGMIAKRWLTRQRQPKSLPQPVKIFLIHDEGNLSLVRGCGYEFPTRELAYCPPRPARQHTGHKAWQQEEEYVHTHVLHGERDAGYEGHMVEFGRKERPRNSAQKRGMRELLSLSLWVACPAASQKMQASPSLCLRSVTALVRSLLPSQTTARSRQGEKKNETNKWESMGE